MGSEAIAGVAEYQNDLEVSLRLYFKEFPLSLSLRFVGLRPDEIPSAMTRLRSDRLTETDQRSAFVILTKIEAAFRVDYAYRCRRRLKDPVSRDFYEIHRSQKDRVRLDDIFETWKVHSPDSRWIIGELRGAFHFRNWFAHGRYAELRPGKDDFDSIYSLAEIVLDAFPLQASG
jgi:hypothetical protein